MQFPPRNAEPSQEAWMRDVETNTDSIASSIDSIDVGLSELSRGANLNFNSAIAQANSFLNFLTDYQVTDSNTITPTYANLLASENADYLGTNFEIDTLDALSISANVNLFYGVNVTAVTFNVDFFLRLAFVNLDAEGEVLASFPFYYGIGSSLAAGGGGNSWSLYPYPYANYNLTDSVEVDVPYVKAYAATHGWTHLRAYIYYSGNIGRYTSAQTDISGIVGFDYAVQEV